MVVLPYNDKQAKGFFKAAGRPDLAEDERFATARARAQNVDQYYGFISELVATRTTAATRTTIAGRLSIVRRLT